MVEGPPQLASCYLSALCYRVSINKEVAKGRVLCRRVKREWAIDGQRFCGEKYQRCSAPNLAAGLSAVVTFGRCQAQSKCSVP